MSDEGTFLRGLLANPGDATLRSVYADWLEERGDPRAAFLRLDPGFERIHYVDWLERDGHIDWYLQHRPEVARLAEERRSTDPARQQLSPLGATIDPGWLAFMETLGCPFRPFFFFSNAGVPAELEVDELPFTDPIGTRGAIITFESAFRAGDPGDPGLVSDLRFLCELRPGNCWSGAATCPIHLFLSELRPGRRRLTAAAVLTALKARAFRSEHIRSLRATRIAYPGYHPGTANDEIHNDPDEQHLFRPPGEDEDEDEGGSGPDPTHAALLAYVQDQHLWYVLLHGGPSDVIGEERQCGYVVLFAVGKSPHGDRLVGVVSHQVCHNLCD
jgi:uncharacterized protein (TIGR02996 family)